MSGTAPSRSSPVRSPPCAALPNRDRLREFAERTSARGAGRSRSSVLGRRNPLGGLERTHNRSNVAVVWPDPARATRVVTAVGRTRSDGPADGVVDDRRECNAGRFGLAPRVDRHLGEVVELLGVFFGVPDADLNCRALG